MGDETVEVHASPNQVLRAVPAAGEKNAARGEGHRAFVYPSHT